MKIFNTSRIATPIVRAIVRAIVRFAAREREVQDFVLRVDVKQAIKREAFRGKCWGRTVLLQIGEDRHYPIAERQYRKHAPAYAVADVYEALAMLAGHEFQHSRQVIARRQIPPEERSRNIWLEVDAERGTYQVLEAFRARREEILGPAMAQARAEREAMEHRAAARAAAAPAEKIADLEARVAKWQTRVKRDTTFLKKWQRRLARARKQAGAEKSS